MSRLLPAARYKALKTRFRQLVDEFGGAEQAATRTRVGATALYNYGNLNSPDNYPPIDVIMDLERDCGQPVVTRELANASGYLMIEHLSVAPSVDKIAVALAAVGRESSDVFALAAKNMADGKVSPQEAQALLRQVDEGITALIAFAAMLRPIADHKRDAFADRMEGTF